jgi:hypothetical protein
MLSSRSKERNGGQLTTSELAADQAATKTIAFTIEGRTLIPALETAIVNGLLAAFPVSLNNLGSLYGTMREMTKIPRM